MFRHWPNKAFRLWAEVKCYAVQVIADGVTGITREARISLYASFIATRYDLDNYITAAEAEFLLREELARVS